MATYGLTATRFFNFTYYDTLHSLIIMLYLTLGRPKLFLKWQIVSSSGFLHLWCIILLVAPLKWLSIFAFSSFQFIPHIQWWWLCILPIVNPGASTLLAHDRHQIFMNKWFSELPGAITGDPTHGKGHEEETWWAKARSGLEGPPEPSQASTPKPESVCFTISCLSPTPLTLTGSYPWPPFSKEIQLRALVNKSPGHNRVFQSKPLWWLSSLPDRFVQTPAATRVIVYGLPTMRGAGSLKHSKNIEPFRELRNY